MRTTKPAFCQSSLCCSPIAPCELLPRGLPGCLVINGVEYAVSLLGYLPPAPRGFVVQGYRLVKGDGETYDVSLVAGRMECDCADWTFCRSRVLSAGPLAHCKHITAVERHLPYRIDLGRPQRAAVAYTYCDLEDL